MKPKDDPDIPGPGEYNIYSDIELKQIKKARIRKQRAAKAIDYLN
jgi:hypothetical protein